MRIRSEALEFRKHGRMARKLSGRSAVANAPAITVGAVRNDSMQMLQSLGVLEIHTFLIAVCASTECNLKFYEGHEVT
jgi:hypothetical protein